MRRERRTFHLGQITATPDALREFALSEESMLLYIFRHACGDWGDVEPEDAAANDEARETGERIISAYNLRSGTRIYIVTEADRSRTCILLPEEY
jgi:hypothetical protein